MLRAAAELSDGLPEATDAILISDCMPTRGATTFPALAGLAARVPSLFICFTEEASPAIRMFHAGRQIDLYEWWASSGSATTGWPASAIPTTSTGSSTCCRPTRHSTARESRPRRAR